MNICLSCGKGIEESELFRCEMCNMTCHKVNQNNEEYNLSYRVAIYIQQKKLICIK